LLFNQIKWTGDLAEAKVIYLHRGAPGNQRVLSGDSILAVRPWYLETESTVIPYHRILQVTYQGKILFCRNKTI